MVKRIENPDPAAAALAAKRHTATFACVVCGREFTALASSKRGAERTCSPKHRAALFRRENPGYYAKYRKRPPAAATQEPEG